MSSLTVAAVQMVSTSRLQQNLAAASELIAEAAASGAELVVLPENFAFMGRDETERLALVEDFSATPGPAQPMQSFLRQAASKFSIWIAGGTIPLSNAADDRAYSAMLLYDPHGQCVARYDKMHLFDVQVPGAGSQYRESASTIPGQRAVVSRVSGLRLGMAVCYDLRFPELFRTMAAAGADIVAVGSAFTVPTGEAHWDSLVRARAIENLTAVVAASQGGDHDAGRQTYGHSMIIDGWGRVLAQIDTGVGVIVADIDLGAQADLRSSFPVLEHRHDRINI